MDSIAKNLEDGRWLTSEDYVDGNSVNILVSNEYVIYHTKYSHVSMTRNHM